MFLFKDTGGRGVLVVCVEDRDRRLQNNGAGVEILVDEVDGAAGELHAVVEGLLLRFEARERGEKRGMDIQDALGKGGDEKRREEAQVACEADEIDHLDRKSTRLNSSHQIISYPVFCFKK